MKILVTGGVGFIGTNLIKRLLKAGHDVYSIDNYSTGLYSNEVDGATYWHDDITTINWEDENYIWNTDISFDVVFHLAAIARIQPSFERPVDYFETNATATMKLAKYCSDNKIPMIYAGSSSHHGGKMKNPYTFSKDIGEEIIDLFQKHYGLQASIARFYNVYGPHHLKIGEYSTLIGKWESCIEKNTPLIIYGDGTKKRDFTHVYDIVDALILILEKESWGNTFELGRGKNYSVLEIAKMFDHPILYREDKRGETLTTLCDYSLAKKLLGWEPVFNIEDYIDEYRKRNDE